MTTVRALLDTLGWSTSQGDAAVEGAAAAETSVPVSGCPYPQPSTLAHPWRAGWIATEAARQAPPDFADRRAAGSLEVVLKASATAGRIAVRVYRDEVAPPGP